MVKNKNKKRKSLIITMICLFLLGAVMVSYAFMYDITYVGQNENKIKTCSFDVSFKDENPIQLNTAYPIADNEIDSIEPYTFYIRADQNTCTDMTYNISMYSMCDNCNQINGICAVSENYNCNCNNGYQIDPNLIKYQLINTRTNEITTGTNPLNMNITKTLTGTITDTYELKLWIDSSATNEDLYIYENNIPVENVDGTYKTKNTCLKLNLNNAAFSNLDTSGANAPELATGMIPVYYDSTCNSNAGCWRKADSMNIQETHKWYDYDESMWANAVTVSDYNYTVVNDLSENNNNVNIHNATLTSEGLSFDGIDDYAVVDSLNFTNSKEMTIDIIATIDDSEGIILETSADANTSNGAFYFNTGWYASSTGLQLTYHHDSSSLNSKYVQEITSPTTFKRFTITFNTTNTYNNFTSIYVDSVNQTVGAVHNGNPSNLTLGTFPLYIGSRGGTTNFTKMIIKELRIYNRELTQEEITTNYEGGNVINGLIAYYDFADIFSRADLVDSALGTEIPMDRINTMLVWIPRFNAVTPSGYNGGTQANPGAIDVTFVDTATAALDAFTLGNQNLTGYWVGKFEVSSDVSCTAINDSTVGIGCNLNTINPKVLPNVKSWGGTQISTYYNRMLAMKNNTSMYGFNTSDDPTLDTHMMKNNEWGAVAYLTQSNYGRCTEEGCSEVWKNPVNTSASGNCEPTITGCSGASVSAAEQPNKNACNSEYEYNGVNNNGNSSTTGNIYGVYDMSGGTTEYVMGNFNSYSGRSIANNYNSGFNGPMYTGNALTGGVSFPIGDNAKYINIYTGTSYTGHALNETAGWYSDNVTFIDSNRSWFHRGGAYLDSTTGTGIFYFSRDDGGSTNCYSARLTLVK